MDGREEALRHTALPASEAQRCQAMARDIGMANLQRGWAILLKGLQEVQHAPDARSALEMTLLRLIYASELPDPARLIREMQSGVRVSGGGAAEMHTPSVHSPANNPPVLMAVAGGSALRKAHPALAIDASPQPQSFEGLIALCEDKGEMLLASQLVNHVHLVKFEVGRFEFRPAPEAPANLAQRLSSSLLNWTGQRWMISISGAVGAETLSQKKNQARDALLKAARESAGVRAVLSVFPGSEIHTINKKD
jgi:DNA polymerase-3 subunit gamma/tau